MTIENSPAFSAPESLATRSSQLVTPSHTMPSQSAPSQEQNGSDSPAAKDVAAAAKEHTAAMAQTVAESSKDVTQKAGEQVAAVADQAKDQLHAVLDQAKGELKTQADARSLQVAAGLQTLADQLSALAAGRPHEAGHVATLVSDAQSRIQAYAQTLHDRGPQALIDDLALFARRRPVRFLFGAAFAGFGAGRLARSGAAVARDNHDAASDQPSFGSAANGSMGQLAAGAR